MEEPARAVSQGRGGSWRAEYRLLDCAVRYALSAARHATPQRLTMATPCAGWDLGTLLVHLGDSFDALAEALSARSIDPCGGPSGGPSGTEGSAGAPSGPETPVCGAPGDGAAAGAELITGLAGSAAVLLWACAEVRTGQEPVAVGDWQLTTSVVAITGAIEVAVHGWDISVSCGDRRPVPSRLATELLPYAALLVPRRARAGLFAEPVVVPRRTSAGGRLVAFLGRQPDALVETAG
jgi:uncharacterized protein (TIGR03083 family)